MAYHIAVVGDSCTDKYVYGSCERLCPEGPVPVINEIESSSVLGMAGNTYNNIKALCHSTLSNIEFFSNDSKQMEKIRFVDNKTNQLLLRHDRNDSCDIIEEDVVNKIVESPYDLVVVSDYCKGFLNNEVIESIGKSSAFSIIDTKRNVTKSIADCFSFIKLNEYEYNKNRDNLADVDSSKLLITLGGRGVFFKDKIYTPEKVINTFDVSGAGDVFTSSFSYRFMTTGDVEESIRFAQKCCCKVIQRRGTCVYEEDMD